LSTGRRDSRVSSVALGEIGSLSLKGLTQPVAAFNITA
jgi:hypothetical protein